MITKKETIRHVILLSKKLGLSVIQTVDYILLHPKVLPEQVYSFLMKNDIPELRGK